MKKCDYLSYALVYNKHIVYNGKDEEYKCEKKVILGGFLPWIF